jgi:hypothetical protein
MLAMGLERFSKGKLKALTTMQSSAGVEGMTAASMRDFPIFIHRHAEAFAFSKRRRY